MKEYFVCSDIHGFYTELITALDDAGWDIENPNHILIICGDILDRGKEALETVNFVYKLLKLDRVLIVKGNHEYLFEEMIQRGYPMQHDISNGTFNSLYQLQGNKNFSSLDLFYQDTDEIMSTHYSTKWDAILESCKDYYELGNYIFVHGWIPVSRMYNSYRPDYDLLTYDPNWRTEGNFEAASWLNGMACAKHNLCEPSKTIVCGHWHTSYGNVRKFVDEGKYFDAEYCANWNLDDMEFAKDESVIPMKVLMGIYKAPGIIALDACTAFSGFVNVLHLTESELYEKN